MDCTFELLLVDQKLVYQEQSNYNGMKQDTKKEKQEEKEEEEEVESVKTFELDGPYC